MNTENQFNTYLGKELMKLSTTVDFMKASDKYQVGVSDFLLWSEGVSTVLEVKFIKEWPKRESSKILSHIFSGPQLTFMHRKEVVGTKAFGLIYHKGEDTMYLIRSTIIPESGNWSMGDFLHRAEVDQGGDIHVISSKRNIQGLIDRMFYREKRW